MSLPAVTSLPVGTARPGAADPDPGLFGPDSVTWRVHGDPSMVIAGLRALLLQALHPVAMAGVAQYSNYRDDPWRRLFRTVEYIGTITYGTTLEAQRAAARVRGVHRRIVGVEPDSGTPYRAFDPDLLLWVHVTEVESLLSTARRCALRLSGAEADAYYAEQVRAAELIGIPPALVPASHAEIAEYYRKIRGDLRLSAEARQAVGFLLWPPIPAWVSLATPARPVWVALAAMGAAMLPRWARRMYRLPGLPTTDIGASLTGLAVRTSLIAIPRTVREGPHQKAGRKRMEAAG